MLLLNCCPDQRVPKKYLIISVSFTQSIKLPQFGRVVSLFDTLIIYSTHAHRLVSRWIRLCRLCLYPWGINRWLIFLVIYTTESLQITERCGNLKQTKLRFLIPFQNPWPLPCLISWLWDRTKLVRILWLVVLEPKCFVPSRGNETRPVDREFGFRQSLIQFKGCWWQWYDQRRLDLYLFLVCAIHLL